MVFWKNFKGFLHQSNATALISYFLSALFTKAVAFLTIPVFTDLLDPVDYGYVNTYTSVVAIASFALGLSLQNAVIGIQKNKEYEEKEYQSAVMTLALLFLVAMTGICYLIKWFFFPMFSNLVFFAAIVQSFATFVISFVSIEWRLHNRYLGYAVINVFPSFCAILLSIFAIWNLQENKYLGRILPTSSVYCLFAVILVFLVLVQGKRFFAPDIWKHALKYSLPLIFHTMSLLILEQSDRIMVASISGMSEAGIYGFTHSFALAIQVVFVALENFWVSWFVKAMQQGDSPALINRWAKMFTELYVLFVVGFIFVSQELVKWMANESYWSGIYYIPLFVIASYLNLIYIFPVNHEYYECTTKKMASVSLLAAGMNIVLNAWIIPYAGGCGAAFTTLLTYLFLAIAHLKISKTLNPSLFPMKIFLRPTAVVLMGTILYYLMYAYWIVRWIAIVIFAGLYSFWMWKEYKKLQSKE